ncbi:siderophore-interacting protein [Shinella zoogloeoides]|uniref:siderophore-interacting protein n=1 Tax=Shinella zoogloeoides TaxID=352475 RepID=UPI0028A6A59E|nr:siderophore-interacting protein [Shinella zoogloeoides]
MTFRTTATVTLDEAETVLGAILDHMEEHATVVRSEAGARLDSPFGTVEIERQADRLLVEVATGSVEILAMIKIFIAEHIFEFATGTPTIAWAGDGTADRLPPHFRELRVLEAFDVTPRMRRLFFRAEDVSTYAGDAQYHVRLLIPPHGRTPRWPSIAADGRMTWPEGEDALVNRVYTIRSVDLARSTVAVDFVLHGEGGSPGADFARQARPGDVVGMLGPAGGGLPQGQHLLLLGDETALPAIARMLESLPQGATADVFVQIEDKAEKQEIHSKGEIRLTWLCRQGSETLEQVLATQLDLENADSKYVWAGCEQQVAARLRAIYRNRFPNARNSYRIVGYWSRQGRVEDALDDRRDGA